MTSKKQELIEVVKGSLPLRLVLKRKEIGQDTSKKLMEEIGLSFDAYGEMLDDIRDEFGIADHPETLKSFNIQRRTFRPDKRVSTDSLKVPDLSVDELLEVVETKVWPLAFYEESSR